MVRLPVPPLPQEERGEKTGRCYLAGGGAAGAGAAGAAGAEAGVCAGAAGAACCVAGACLVVVENCCNTELPGPAPTEFSCMVSAIDVSMNMMAHQVVAFERNV